MSSQILCFGCGSRDSDKTAFEEFYQAKSFSHDLLHFALYLDVWNVLVELVIKVIILGGWVLFMPVWMFMRSGHSLL